MEEERGELEHVYMLMCTYMYVCKGFAPPFNKILFIIYVQVVRRYSGVSIGGSYIKFLLMIGQGVLFWRWTEPRRRKIKYVF